jgi:hypothetical protein
VSTPRQWAANRENAQKSTGPRTDEGKRRSRRNALRHGLVAETVIEIFEDIEDYKAFEANVIADYDVTTAVERELVLRLASLLWRIRRAVSIETDLLRIQAEILRDRQKVGDQQRPPVYRQDSENGHTSGQNGAWPHHGAGTVAEPPRRLTQSFLRLANLDQGAFERLGRYEATLWRQIVQTVFVLRPRRRRQNALTQPFCLID